MRVLNQLETMIDQMPGWTQLLVAVGLVLYTAISIYGRINVRVGQKVFSRVSAEELRSNMPHIIKYTVVPAVVCIGYIALLATK